MAALSETRFVQFDDYVYDLNEKVLFDKHRRRIELRSKVLGVLHELACQVDCVVEKESLISAVWSDVIVTDDSLVQCVLSLRRALKDNKHRIVKTVPRRGYRLVASHSTYSADTQSDSEQIFPQKIRFAHTKDDIRIAYAISGSGSTTLVRTPHWMTHLEWDGCSSVYGPTLRRWSESRVLLRYDGRGCGLSDRCVPVGTLDDEVDDLEAVVDSAGVKRFALLGRSQGGPIAIRYAARHPNRVSHLVLMGSFAQGSLIRDDGGDAYAKVTEQSQLLYEAWGRDNPAFHKLITSFMFPTATPEQVASFNHLQKMAISPDDLVTVFQMICQYDVLADLPSIQCPTLVIHSSKDAIVPFAQGRLLASTIPSARLYVYDSLNHTPLPGDPEWSVVMDEIDAFLMQNA